MTERDAISPRDGDGDGSGDARSRRADRDLGPDAGAVPDADDGDPDKGPLRRCLVSRNRGDPAGMIRFVVSPDRAVVPDLAARLPGRGMWLSARKDVLEAAVARNSFARAARGAVAVPPDLAPVVVAALRHRLADTIAMARKAGQAVAGFQKAQAWLSGRAGLVVQASDGSAEERARFLRAPGSRWEGPVVLPLDAAALGAAFGRDRAVHVAVSAGRIARTIGWDAERLAGLVGLAECEMRVERTVS